MAKSSGSLNDVYPHQVIDREDNFGIGYLCRMPPESVRYIIWTLQESHPLT